MELCREAAAVSGAEMPYSKSGPVSSVRVGRATACQRVPPVIDRSTVTRLVITAGVYGSHTRSVYSPIGAPLIRYLPDRFVLAV